MEAVLGYDLETLMRTFGNDVLRTAYMYVKDIHTAEDIFQDVFLKANNSLHTFQGNSSVKTWLIRITINTCKDYLKSAYHRHTVPMDEFVEDNISTEDDFSKVERQETQQSVKEAVMELPEHYKDVIMCVYYQEMTMDQASQMLSLIHI